MIFLNHISANPLNSKSRALVEDFSPLAFAHLFLMAAAASASGASEALWGKIMSRKTKDRLGETKGLQSGNHLIIMSERERERDR